MSERDWYYVEAGSRRGPHTVEELGEAVRRLGGSTLVWRTGFPEWVPAESVPELADVPSAPAGGPPSVPVAGAARDRSAEPYTLSPLVLWRRCFDWSGRFSRSEFAVAHLGFSVLGGLLIGLAAGLAAAFGGEEKPAAWIVFGVLMLAWIPLAFVVSVGSTVRRLHDLGQSGWLALLTFVPCVNLGFLVYLLAAPGRQGAAPASGSMPVPVLVVLLAVLVLAVPMMIGIVAAIAIPSLLRARVSANEAAAIGNVRMVISAEAAYQAANQGFYEGRSECLSRPEGCIPAYAGPSFVDAAVFEGPRSGYVLELHGGARPPTTAGTSPSSTEAFAVIAYPAVPGKTGVRAFCGDATGRVCAIVNGSREELVTGASGQPGVGCSAACRDLR
jgi:uncharacterized membrane protein YhaH (DUF805 family)/type II secretory pathway pseudopilin PulG